jgi:hypothetical protein
VKLIIGQRKAGPVVVDASAGQEKDGREGGGDRGEESVQFGTEGIQARRKIKERVDDTRQERR